MLQFWVQDEKLVKEVRWKGRLKYEIRIGLSKPVWMNSEEAMASLGSCRLL